VISGTPTTTGEYRPTFTVEDTDGNRDTVTLDRRSEWVVQ